MARRIEGATRGGSTSTKDLNSRKQKRLKIWVLIGGFTVWAVSISGVFGNSGILQAYKLADVRREMSLKIRALENEKAYLQHSLQALDKDSFVQESAIRESLGFVRPGELVFEFR